MLSVAYAECQKRALWAKCQYRAFRYAKRHYDECRDAQLTIKLYLKGIKYKLKMAKHLFHLRNISLIKVSTHISFTVTPSLPLYFSLNSDLTFGSEIGETNLIIHIKMDIFTVFKNKQLVPIKNV